MRSIPTPTKYFLSFLVLLLFSFTHSLSASYPSIEILVEEVIFGHKGVSTKPRLEVGRDPRKLYKALSILEEQFTEEHYSLVKEYLQGQKEIIDLQITPASSRAFLSAAKWIDLKENSEPHLNIHSTFAIRLESLHKSEGAIVTVDAMSHTDIPFFLLVDDQALHTQPDINSTIQKELAFIPEWTNFQRELLTLTFQANRTLSDRLNRSRPTQLIIRGISGAGKTSYAMNHPLLKGSVKNDGPLSGIQNSDNIKRIMSERYFLNNEQVHKEGACLRKGLFYAILDLSINMTVVSDGIFDQTQTLEMILQSLEQMDGQLMMIDLDTPLIISSLRVINRGNYDPYSPSPTFSNLASIYKKIRRARQHTINQMIKTNDTFSYYQLLVTDSENTQYLVAEKNRGKFHVAEGMEPLLNKAIQSEGLEEEIEIARTHIIDDQDIEIYGDGLIPFLGMTVEDALQELNEAPIEEWNLSLYFTGDSQSQLKLCRQESLQMQCRRNTFFTRQKNKRMNTLFIDGGNAQREKATEHSSSNYIDLLMSLNYDVAQLGSYDFNRHLEEVIFRPSSFSLKLPLLCSNILNPETGAPAFKPYTILERGGHRIAVIGLIGPKAWGEVNEKIANNFYYEDPTIIAEKILSEVQDKVDLVIAVSHAEHDYNLKLSNLPLFDVIVGARSQSAVLRKPTIVKNGLNNGIGGTIVHHCGAYGQYVGMIHLKIKKGKIIGYKGKAKLMDGRYDSLD